MHILKVVLLLHLIIPNVFAQTFCPGGLPQDALMNKVFMSADVMNCMATRERYKCIDIEEELEGSDKNKVIKCDVASIESNRAMNASLPDCIWNGIKISVKAIENIGRGIAKGFQDTQVCNQSIDRKREILKGFNLVIDDERFKLEEKFLGKWLEDASCAELDRLVSSRYQNYESTLQRERKLAIDMGKKPAALRENEGKSGPGLIVMLKTAMAEVNVKYECYTPKVKAEMICAGLTSLVVDTALGGGIVGAGKAIARIVKSKNALTTIRASAAAKTEIELASSGVLLNGDRVKAASAVLGRELSAAEQKAIINAHNIGSAEGRGFYTYTADDLLKKNRILRDAGFTNKAERDALMRSGITGEFSVNEAGKIIAASMTNKVQAVTNGVKSATVREFNIALREYNATTDPVLKANYARLLGEMSAPHDIKTAKAFYQLGFDKVKKMPDADAGFFGRTKTLDNYLDLASRAGEQGAVKKGMSEYVKREFSIDAKRLGWKNTAEAANEIYSRLEDEVQHQLKNGKVGEIYIAAARRKQKALLEEFKYIDQTGRRIQSVESDLARFAE